MPKNKKIFGSHKSAKHEIEEAVQSATAEIDAVKQDLKSDKSEKQKKTPVRFWDVLSLKALKDNSVLVRILAVCTVLGAATALKNGLLLSAAAAAVTIPLYIIMALFFKKVPAYLYFAAALFIAGAIITPVTMFANSYFPEIVSSSKSLEYFLPITAINAVLVLDIRITRGERSIIRSLSAALGDVLGFSVVLIVISALREVIGYGTLYGRVIPDYAQFRFNFALLPPGAFLLMGFVLAIVQGIRLHSDKNNNDGEVQ
jgi:electron transport complex protein RnfE